MNSSQAQTVWVVLIFALVLGSLAFGAVGISGAESIATTQLAAGSGDVQEARVGFLGWGAIGAVIAASAMRWIRSASEEEGHASSVEPRSPSP